ncbi:MAG TPA: heme exporter protein CcmB [Anaerolineales bacterium]|nr:heme exporter protein CcmB [Anaerolineales bacterium]
MMIKKNTAYKPSFIKSIIAITRKDISAEMRSRELLSSMLVFSMLVVLIYYFALELDIKAREAITAGALWVTFSFAGTLGLNRSMAVEKDRGCLDGLLLAPVDRSAIYFGKMISNLVFMFIVEVIVIPLYAIMYNVDLLVPGFIWITVLGSIGYVAVGTLLSAMTVQTRTRDVLLPILLFPLVIPVLIAAVKASSGFIQGSPMEEILPWMNLLIVYDIVFTAVSYMVFDNIVEE